MFARAVLLLALAGPAAGEPPEGEVLGVVCSSCHGGEAGSLPDLGRLSPAEIKAALEAFRSGERTGTLMNRLAKGYSIDEIEALAQALGDS